MVRPAGRPDGAVDDLSRNHLLAALPSAVQAVLRPHLTRVVLAASDVLYAPTKPMTDVYFPKTVVASVVTLLGNDAPSDVPAREGAESEGGAIDDATRRGSAVEVGTVGCEGMVGLGIFLSGSEGATSDADPVAPSDFDVRRDPDTPGVRAVAQVPGEAWRMPADTFAVLAAAPGPLQRQLLRYTQAYLAQVTQTAACNAAHGLEARCARWLLTTRDRTVDDRLPLTHAFLAAMLGVRETGVATALAALAAQGFVVANREAVEILDRPGLERATCACYAAVRAEYARLLGPPPGTVRYERPE